MQLTQAADAAHRSSSKGAPTLPHTPAVTPFPVLAARRESPSQPTCGAAFAAPLPASNSVLASPLGHTVLEYESTLRWLRFATPASFALALWLSLRLVEDAPQGWAAAPPPWKWRALATPLVWAFFVFNVYGLATVPKAMDAIRRPCFGVVVTPGGGGAEKAAQGARPATATALVQPAIALVNTPTAALLPVAPGRGKAGSGLVYDSLLSLPRPPPSCGTAQGAVTLHALYSERLGNNAFQYVAARLRAAYLGLPFAAPRLGAPFEGLPTHVDAWSTSTSDASASCGSGASHAFPLSPLDAARIAAAVEAGSFPASRGAALCDALSHPALTAHRGAWLSAATSGYVMCTGQWRGHVAAVRRWFGPSIAAALAAARAGAGLASNAARIVATAATEGGDAAAASSSYTPYVLTGPVVHWASPTDVAVHVRLGDIMWGHHAAYRPLPLSFYKRALQEITARVGGKGEEQQGEEGEETPVAATSGLRARRPARAASAGRGGSSGAGAAPSSSSSSSTRPPLHTVVLVTEDATHEVIGRMVTSMRRWGLACHIVAQSISPGQDMLTCLSAPNLVLSTSTFAWWGAFLGVARNVVWPAWGVLLKHHWSPNPSAGPSAVALHDLTLLDSEAPGSDPASAATPEEALARFTAVAVAANNGEAGPPFPSSRVIALDCSTLGRWGGNFRHTLETLFDA